MDHENILKEIINLDNKKNGTFKNIPTRQGYRKGFRAQYPLISLIERWRLCIDKQGFAGALLMDLSKVFDTINHELLIAKLHPHGFSIEALEVLLIYLQERW